jgi:hypothetical protein
MIKITPGVGNPTHERWKMINFVIRKQIWQNPDLMTLWNNNGYEGISELVPELLGMSAMYRDDKHTVTFEFTEKQWTVFALKWL